MSSSYKFGKIRSLIWPIHSFELAKFLPMFLVFFLIAFNYSILKTVKDTLIVTDPTLGAEAIPFMKTWAILPMAFLMTLIFTKLSSKYSLEKVFYIIMCIFLGFFALFTFVLYPLREVLHPTAFADKLAIILPQGFKGLISIIRNWTLTGFYVMAELWGTAILNVLFWGFANEVTTINEAKRFYSLFGVGANFSNILSGQAAIWLSSNLFLDFIPYGKTSWEQSVLFMNLIILMTGIFIILLFRYINKKTYKQNIEPTISQVKKPKIKLSLRKSFAYLAQSKYLIFLALIVLSYSFTTHIAEVVWKNQIKQIYPNPSDFNIYMGHITRWIGIIATIFALFISGNFLRRFSWTISAIFTPIVVLITGTFFFSFFIFDSISTPFAQFFNATPLIMSVFFGSFQNILSRSSKFTLFDATKEIAFIPLDKESKRKGKAAIDGVGSRLGKSSGAIITQGLLIMFSTLTASTPYIAILFIIMVGIWVFSILSLGKKFNQLTSHNEKIIIEEKMALPPPSPVNIEETIKKHYPFNVINKKKVKK